MVAKPREERTYNGGAEREPPVGVVLAGAGARGAYEAGMLSVLLPRLGDEPKIFVGTSAGALNAALFASLAHKPADEAAEEAVEVWRSIHRSMVLRPAWATLPAVGVSYVASLLGLPRRLTSLLDTAPLMRTLQTERIVDWNQLHENVSRGRVRMLAVATTEVETGRTKIFCESSVHGALPESDEERAVDYVATREINCTHVAASAAIPIAFPPIRIGTRRASTWHMDGGVRLNAPLKPAIALGARSLAVISTDPGQYKPAVGYPASEAAPTVQDAAYQVARAVLGDRLVEDIRTLERTNTFLKEDVKVASRAGRKYERIPYVFGGPDSEDSIRDRAAQALSEALHGVRALTNPDLALLNVVLGMSPGSRSDLLSYIFFEPEFIQQAITLGQEDGERLVSSGPLWKLEGSYSAEEVRPEARPEIRPRRTAAR
ncbi:patatin-like phospholipase family protein [Planosporangium sp. 12N6]|uniref:patatin-like phospholipase family protein n=1 Tax=Planosporangium spinosum TaxID=3402278 RepID=UPI003CED68A1